MNRPSLSQSCWNHESRQAVCRCPECRRSFCRECISEHESRLLCAACLRAIAHAPPPPPRSPAVFIALALAGVFLGWLIFFIAGEAVITFVARLEQT